MNEPRIRWDIGTAYDLFVSLTVLHKPERFGLRPAWAAGVRSRLPHKERQLLNDIQVLVGIPTHWIYHLPQPKDAQSALDALKHLSPSTRVKQLFRLPGDDSAWNRVMSEVIEKESWSEDQLTTLRQAWKKSGHSIRREKLIPLLERLAAPDEFGRLFLSALSDYYRVFFAEEEDRIRPALENSLLRAQGLARELTATDLLEELTQGLRLTAPLEAAELVLVPSFWCTPLLVFGHLDAQRDLLLFGARPADASLVPGEIIPDDLFQALKALADPTRLRIMRYLDQEPLTPSELARRLRLRPPTVVHHLDTLRLAQLVHLTMESKDRRRYAAREGAVQKTFESLKRFLSEDRSTLS